MNKLFFAGVFVLVTSSFLSCKQPVEKRPNVIVILTDDQEIEEIAKFKGKVLTPNMDRIATDGVILDKYYVNSPVCSPSRYSLLTGRYASRNKNIEALYPANEPAFIRWNTDLIAGKEQTIAHIMKDNGYATGMVGKWHLGQPLAEETYFETNNLDPYQPEVASRIKSFYKGMQDYVKKAGGFDYVESLYGNNLHALGLPATVQQHNMEWVTKGALDFLDQNNPEKTEKPFFLYFAPMPPHLPDPVISMHSDPRITPAGILKEPIIGVQPSRESVFERVKAAGFDKSTAHLTWLDDGIGALLQKLEEMKILDNTIILFMSDNGCHVGKMTCFEVAAHMPAMIMWNNKIKSNTHNKQLFSNIDILPTILNACNIEKPKGFFVDGISMLPAIMHGKPTNRDFLYLEVVYQRSIITDEWQYIATRFPSDVQKTVTTSNRKLYSIEGEKQPDRYKAEKYFPGYFDDDQLYNLANDPNEQKNIASNPKNADQLSAMKERLDTVVASLYNSFGEFGKK
jgi:arylsulfatase A-like enzyme